MDPLRETVLDFVERVRARPSESVGPALDDLKQAAMRSEGHLAANLGTPIADYTWMSSLDLDPANNSTELDPVDIPHPLEIVGMKFGVILLDITGALVEPPPEAIDIFLQINRKDTLTARADKVQTLNDDTEVVSMIALDATIANRIVRRRLDLNTDNTISWRLRWAVDAATRTGLKYSSVRVRMNWFINYLRGDRAR